MLKKAGFGDVNADFNGIKKWTLFLNICYSVNKVSVLS
jgi:hypothetical protein